MSAESVYAASAIALAVTSGVMILAVLVYAALFREWILLAGLSFILAIGLPGVIAAMVGGAR